MNRDILPEYIKKRVLILGCGNILFGDDGFGPATIDHIHKNLSIPDDVYVMDVGTGARDVLFNIGLSEQRPEKIIVIDAMDLERTPGEVFEISIEDIPENKKSDYSIHHLPTTNLLKDLRDIHQMKIIIITCQVERIPELVSVGLSEPVRRAVPKAAELALLYAT